MGPCQVDADMASRPRMKSPVYRSPRKPKGHGNERREEILAAALRLFGQKGLSGVSTRQIAEAAGISQPALYAYFATKDEIAETLCIRAFEDLLRQLVAAREATVPERRFEALARVYVRFGLENPDAYRVAFMLEHTHEPSPEEDKIFQAGRQAFEVLLGEVMRLAAERGWRGIDPMGVAQSLWASMHGLVSLLLARPSFPWVDQEALIATHLGLLHAPLEGLGRE